MMKFNVKKEVELYMIFDILADTVRTGPQLWHVDRERLEDVQNHIVNLIFIARILRRHLPDILDYNLVYDYILVHDLPEAITGDITHFEGVPEEEIKKVTSIAIDYLADKFRDVIDFRTLIGAYEERKDLEAKFVHIIDKVHSSIAFIKYQSEKNIDVNNQKIIPELRNLPFVDERIKKGYDVADVFFEYHRRAIEFSDEECSRYGITRTDADRIVMVIREFIDELYREKVDGNIFDIKISFPKEAEKYKREKFE